MRNIFHEFLNPHCEHCREEREESRICLSCETLKLELERLRRENDKLLEALLRKPTEESKPIDTSNLIPIKPTNVPWAVRRQILEREDRAAAKLMQVAAKPSNEKTDAVEMQELADLEREVLGAEQARENSGK